MSTKSSVAYKTWETKHLIHIYIELQDGCYYLETEEERIKIPKKYGELFAKALNQLNEEELKTES